MSQLIWIVLGLWLALTTGCAKHASESYPAPSYELVAEEADWDDYKAAAAPSPMRARAESEPTPTAPATPTARKVHYSGYAKLKVTRTDELVEQVVAAAEEAGGYVESRTLSRATVRVPADRFAEVFEAYLGLGDVLDKSISAQDVTEAYQDVELRLATARATLERLQELLARAESDEDKLELLRQIQRLTQEIDTTEAHLRTLESLSAFSRITVEGVARSSLSARRSRAVPQGFEFLERLSPFRRDVSHGAHRLVLEVPEGMVALDERGHFAAEGPDGAALWTSRLPNEPQGTAVFWAEAARERLGSEFTGVEVEEVGPWQVLRLVEAGAEDPYRYLLGFRVEGKWLHLVEVYYPSPAHEERYAPGVDAVLAGGDA